MADHVESFDFSVASGNITGSIAGSNMTVSGGTYSQNVTGYSKSGITFNGTTDFASSTVSGLIDGTTILDGAVRVVFGFVALPTGTAGLNFIVNDFQTAPANWQNVWCSAIAGSSHGTNPSNFSTNYRNGGNNYGSSTPTIDTVIQLTHNFDGSNASIQFNGSTNEVTGSGSASVSSPTPNLTVARRSQTAQSYTNITVFSVDVFSGELSASEEDLLWGGGTPPLFGDPGFPSFNGAGNGGILPKGTPPGTPKGIDSIFS